MDMSLEDTLADLGLDDEATVFPLTGTGVGMSSLSPACGRGVIERTQHSHRADSVCPWHPRELLGHCPQGGGGGSLALKVGDLGQDTVVLAPQLSGAEAEGPGTFRDDWCQCSSARLNLYYEL